MSGAYTIVVGLDGSPRAPHVLAAAVDFARARGGELILLRGIGFPLELPDEALSVPRAEVPTLLTEFAELELAKLATSVPADLLVAKRVRAGIPWEAIVEEAKASHADLIVIGSHGYRGLDKVLGTTAAKVVNHAPCSTLVIRSTGSNREGFE